VLVRGDEGGEREAMIRRELARRIEEEKASAHRFHLVDIREGFLDELGD
jgi:hypothetical protein